MQDHLQERLQSEEMVQLYTQTVKLDRAHLFDLTADRHFGEGQARDAAELRPCWLTIGIISSFLRRLPQK
jgi:hypothetical protein